MSAPIPILHRFVAQYARGRNHPAKLRVLNWLCRLFRLSVLICETEVGLMRLNVDDFVQARVFTDGIFEPRTIQLLKELLKNGDCFVDIGANVGVFSLAAARCVGREGCVIAIEPNPEICADLLFNRRLNGFEKIIRVVLTAANEKDCMLRFGVPSRFNRGMSREQLFDVETDDGYFVSGLRVGKILETMSITSVNVVKIDVEGSELRVLKGLFEDSKMLPPTHILFEFIPDHFSYGKSPTELLEYLQYRDYEILTITGSQYRSGELILEQNLWARSKNQ
jgi:FkbM family methyltransferase